MFPLRRFARARLEADGTRCDSRRAPNGQAKHGGVRVRRDHRGRAIAAINQRQPVSVTIQARAVGATGGAACPHGGAVRRICQTGGVVRPRQTHFAAAKREAEVPCSENTAEKPVSSLTLSPLKTTRALNSSSDSERTNSACFLWQSSITSPKCAGSPASMTVCLGLTVGRSTNR